jgi:hypothetical protein
MNTNSRIEKRPEERNIFDRTGTAAKAAFKKRLGEDDAQEAATPKVETARRPQTSTGLREDPKLTAARLAEQNRRVVVKQNEQRDAMSASILNNQDAIKGLAALWMSQRPAYHSCDFNDLNLSRALHEYLYKARIAPTFAILDDIFQFLSKNNYLLLTNAKQPGRIFRLAIDPPQVYPEFITPEETETQEEIRAVGRAFQRNDELKAARAMSDEELAAIERQRQQYRLRPQATSDIDVTREYTREELLAMPVEQHRRILRAQRQARYRPQGSR